LLQTGQHSFQRAKEVVGFKNADIQLTDEQLLANIRRVQQRQNLPLSDKLVSSVSPRIPLRFEICPGKNRT
jgi:type III restriction enzyme